MIYRNISFHGNITSRTIVCRTYNKLYIACCDEHFNTNQIGHIYNSIFRVRISPGKRCQDKNQGTFKPLASDDNEQIVHARSKIEIPPKTKTKFTIIYRYSATQVRHPAGILPAMSLMCHCCSFTANQAFELRLCSSARDVALAQAATQ
jgi:hypothetical protein